MNWISCKIFHDTSFEIIIHDLVVPIIKKIEDNCLLDSFFYLRYWENGPHLRFRVLPKKTENKKIVQTIISSEFNNFQSAFNKNSTLTFDEYIPEFNRYGGEEAILIAEKCFEFSSRSVSKLIEENIDNWNYNTSMSYALQMNTIFIKELFKNEEKSLDFLNYQFNNRLAFSLNKKTDDNIELKISNLLNYFKKSYINQKSTINYIVKAIWEDDFDDKIFLNWKGYCKKISSVLKANPIFSELRNEYIPGKIMQEANYYSILESYIHMNNNRLGINLRDESFISYLLISGMKDILNMK